MKKLVAVLVLLLGAIAILPAYAQDEEVASCSAEEFNEVTAEVSESINSFLESLSTEEEVDAAALTAIVIELDGFAQGYWEGFSEAAEEDICIELFWYGYNAGLIIDDLLITAQMSAIALHEADAGNAEAAEALMALAETRSEMLNANAEAFNANVTSISEGAGLVFEYVECSEEELVATEEALGEVLAAYEEIAAAAEAEEIDFAELTVGFGELSNGFWTEFMPAVPACVDAQDVAFSTGLVLDESLIIVSLYYLAEIQATLGDEEAATVLAESADVRAESLTAMLEELEGDDEGEEEGEEEE